MSGEVHIQFEDDVISPITSNGGGVYNLRQRTRTGTGSSKAASLNRQSTKETDVEAEASPVEEMDLKPKQVCVPMLSPCLVDPLTASLSGLSRLVSRLVSGTLSLHKASKHLGLIVVT